jgi:hypothetical protein
MWTKIHLGEDRAQWWAVDKMERSTKDGKFFDYLSAYYLLLHWISR